MMIKANRNWPRHRTELVTELNLTELNLQRKYSTVNIVVSHLQAAERNRSRGKSRSLDFDLQRPRRVCVASAVMSRLRLRRSQYLRAPQAQTQTWIAPQTQT